MRNTFLRGMAVACWLFSGAWAHHAHASDLLDPDEEYQKKIKSAQVTSPLSGDIFGEQISLYDLAVNFHATDVDLPGNDGLPVRVGRDFPVENRAGEHKLPGFSDWEIDIPRVYGDFRQDKGWVTTSSTPTARCSVPAKPDAAIVHNGVTLTGTIDDIWHGYYLHAGGADQELLVDSQSKLPAMSDGTTRPWITAQGWRLGCVSSTANSYGGEGFLAVSPQGVKYTFDYAVSVPIKSYQVAYSSTDKVTIDRSEVSLLVSRIEDRFGNYVTYSYSSGKLTAIQASDGRSIALSYDSNGNIATIQAGGRAWSYTYETTTAYPDGYGSYRLKKVTLPDGSAWTYTLVSGSLMPTRDVDDVGGTACRAEPLEMFGNFVLEVDHPSGAAGTFSFTYRRQHMNHAPIPACQNGTLVAVPTPWVPAYFDGYGLSKKVVTGPGISSQTWTYATNEPLPLQYYSSGAATDPCASCTASKPVTVTAPDGTVTVYNYGFMYGLNAGRLLGTSQQDASGNTLSSEVDTFIADDEVSSQPFPAVMGDTLLRIPNPLSNTVRPLRSRAITRDGTTFTWQVNSYDAWARTLSETKSNTLGYTRTDSTAYHDNPTRWVLGQVASVSNTNTGLVLSSTSYDSSTDLPLQAYAYGKLKQTLTYNSDGTVATVKDGNGNTTTLASWKRGIPQSIGFADGSSRSAVVSDAGWITSVTDENGYATGYGYDGMGRISSVTYPSGDSTSWNATTQAFEAVSSSEYGIAAGHWRQTVATGNARKLTYYDAYWRPLLTREYDAGNEAATTRFQAYSYDYAGRTLFASYPASTSAPTTGTWSEYDALGRTTSVSQDSEQGTLTTLSEYLSGNQVRITNPRGFQTITQYQAFDQPTYDSAVLVQQPEGAYTQIDRDVLGMPYAITRRNADASVSVVRSYVYDAYRELCKTVEPETGASIMAYDGAGNLSWSASGQSYTSLSDCSTSSVADTQKVARGYDARNRLAALSFPDGIGSQLWSYTADGLPSQVITYNSSGGDAVTNAYVYNRRRLLTGESESLPGNYTWSLGYGYDANGALASLAYPTGATISYAPNALGQATQAGSYATGVSYYPNGAIKQFTYGNGIVHTMTQNARQLPARSTDSGGGNPLDLGFSYDANGNVGAVTDYTSAARQTRSMSYDGQDRLLTAQSVMFGGDNIARYSYDVFDNLRTAKLGSSQDYVYTYNSGQQLMTVSTTAGAAVIGLGYDARGNLANKNGVVYSFDQGNRLRSVTGEESYRYDAQGRRVSATSPTLGSIYSYYDHDGVLRYQRDERSATVLQYVSLGGSLVARIRSSVLPAGPTLNAPSSSTTGSYSVSWSSISGATGYELQEQTNGGSWSTLTSGTATSQSVSGKPSGSYAYRVRSCLNANCSEWSATATVTVLTAPTSAPTLTTPALATSASYTVSWTTVDTTVSYNLEESTDGGSTWSGIQSSGATSYSASGKTTGSYVYRIKACNSSGCGPYSATATTVVNLSPPAVPGDAGSYRYYLTSGSTKTLMFYIAWNTVAGATSYETTGVVSYTGTGIVSSDGTWAHITHTRSSTATLAVQIRACNANGCSAWSSAFTPPLDSLN